MAALKISNITNKVWNNVKVLNLEDIDELHNLKQGASAKVYHCHIRRMNENNDFFKLTSNDYTPYRYNVHYNYPRGGTLITKQGYEKILYYLGIPSSDGKSVIDEYFSSSVTTSTPMVKASAPSIKKNATANPVVKVDKPKKTKIVEFDKVDATVVENPKPVEPIKSMSIDGDNMFTQFIDLQRRQLELQAKQIELQSKQVNDLSKIVNNVLDYLMSQPRIVDTVIADDNDDVDEEITTQDFETWKVNIFNAVDKIIGLGDENYRNRNAVLSDAYNLLRKEYGVVWEQDKKEFVAEYNRNPARTLELAWYIEQKPVYHNMLIAKLNNMYGEIKRK